MNTQTVSGHPAGPRGWQGIVTLPTWADPAPLSLGSVVPVPGFFVRAGIGRWV
jgi:hypothetical protein